MSLNNSVKLELNGETYTLNASLANAMAISDQFGGFIGAFQALTALNLKVACFIVRTGTNGKGPDGRAMSSELMNERVWQQDISTLTAPLAKYIDLLQRGGKPKSEEDEPVEATTQGNE